MGITLLVPLQVVSLYRHNNMATYREMIYMVLDELKIASDDAYYTEDHVKFLLIKYRAFLLKQEAEKNKEISTDNMQTLCLELEETNMIPDLPCEGGKVLKSTEKIPDVETGIDPKVFLDAYFINEIAYVSKERFRYVGYNRWLQNIIYATIGPDNYLYLRSANPQFIYLRNAKLSAVFSDPEEAQALLCDEDSEQCDILDTAFPLEDALIPQCIQLTVKELSGAIYRPKDQRNNASDDLSEMASFLRNNMKSNFQKQIDG